MSRFSTAALNRADREAEGYNREHVTPFWESGLFSKINLAHGRICLMR